MLVCERNVSPSCRKKIITLPIKKVSKNEETEYFSMEVHKPESWDYCANALYVQNSLWVRFSRWIIFSMMQQNFVKSSLAEREGFVGCHETNSLVRDFSWQKIMHARDTKTTLSKHWFSTCKSTLFLFCFVFFPHYLLFSKLFFYGSFSRNTIWRIFASWIETLVPSLREVFCVISYAHFPFLCFKITAVLR